MTRTARWFALAAILTMGSTASAERPIDPPKLATHIVTGTVEKIFHRDGSENDEYLVMIRIDSIEKGKNYKKGDRIFAYAYKRKHDAPRVPASSGHVGMPKENQRVRARIKRGDGRMEGLYPYWFDVLKPVEKK